MLEKLDQSSGNVLGYKAIGTLTKDDYATMTTDVEALLQQEEEESICLLLDMEDFEKEKVRTWGADIMFGHEYRKKIDKMAIVGDKKWHEWIAALADPFYAREAEFFTTDEREAAWEWLKS